MLRSRADRRQRDNFSGASGTRRAAVPVFTARTASGCSSGAEGAVFDDPSVLASPEHAATASTATSATSVCVTITRTLRAAALGKSARLPIYQRRAFWPVGLCDSGGGGLAWASIRECHLVD